MAKKRGESGLSLVIGVDKPLGMSSHDVVNGCRRIFGERRVGHTGTLDPGATGALMVCIGPAARLDAYLSHDKKSYLARICLGASTETDDAEGLVTERLGAPACVLDPLFAQEMLDGFIGEIQQMPPVYSALKVGGQKACDQARKGHVIDLQPRTVMVEKATLLRIVDGGGSVVFSSSSDNSGLTDNVSVQVEAQSYEGLPYWDVAFSVSKGTYIRSLARDLGLRIGCGAHLRGLRRTVCGNLTLDDCVSLATLEEIGARAALDPVVMLGTRFVYLDQEQAGKVSHGNPLRASEVELCERRYADLRRSLCACTSGVRKSCEPANDGEVVALLYANSVVALYAFSSAKQQYACKCMFPQPIVRGVDF